MAQAENGTMLTVHSKHMSPSFDIALFPDLCLIHVKSTLLVR